MSKLFPQILKQALPVTVRSLNEKTRSVRVIASTSSLDSYAEILEQSWDLSRYEQNPVVLYGHNHNGVFGMRGAPEDSLPIGYATAVEVKNGRLEATLNFVDEKASPMAEMVWQGFVQGSIRAVSVGFYPRNVREEMRDGKEVYVLSDNELFEISVVPIGANPDAVALSANQNRDSLRKRLASRTPSKPEEQSWVVELDSGAEIPMLPHQVRTLVAKGTLHATTVVRRKGTTEDRFLREIPELNPIPAVPSSAGSAAPAPKPAGTRSIDAGSAIARGFLRQNPEAPLPRVVSQTTRQAAPRAAKSMVARNAMASALRAKNGATPMPLVPKIPRSGSSSAITRGAATAVSRASEPDDVA